MNVETHPWKPFIPPRARILFLGSFPPPEKRWSMPFFYPNLQNDFWRIMGLIYFEDKNAFLTPDLKRFNQDKIERFLEMQKIALYDTGAKVIRLDGNASDNRLQIIEPVKLDELLRHAPECNTLAATGQKALEEILKQTSPGNEGIALALGDFLHVTLQGRAIRLFRMPSSSRAYPKSVEWKAALYRRALENAASGFSSSDV